VCNANCSTTGLVVALKPLHDAFGIDECTVVTMQAISGAGYPGVASMDIIENVIPYISGEEDKVTNRPATIACEPANTEKNIYINFTTT